MKLFASGKTHLLFEEDLLQKLLRFGSSQSVDNFNYLTKVLHDIILKGDNLHLAWIENILKYSTFLYRYADNLTNVQINDFVKLTLYLIGSGKMLMDSQTINYVSDLLRRGGNKLKICDRPAIGGEIIYIPLEITDNANNKRNIGLKILVKDSSARVNILTRIPEERASIKRLANCPDLIQLDEKDNEVDVQYKAYVMIVKHENIVMDWDLLKYQLSSPQNDRVWNSLKQTMQLGSMLLSDFNWYRKYAIIVKLLELVNVFTEEGINPRDVFLSSNIGINFNLDSETLLARIERNEPPDTVKLIDLGSACSEDDTDHLEKNIYVKDIVKSILGILALDTGYLYWTPWLGGFALGHYHNGINTCTEEKMMPTELSGKIKKIFELSITPSDSTNIIPELLDYFTNLKNNYHNNIFMK